jgi:glycosyltransferase 2 family protein
LFVDSHKKRELKGISLTASILSWKTLIAVVVAALIIYSFSRGFKGEDLKRLSEHLHRINPVLYVSAFLAYYTAYLFLGLRYKVLLGNSGIKITFRRAVLACFMSAAANAALPTKVGDVYRAYLVRKHSGAPMAAALGVTVGERVLDLSFVCGWLFLLSWVLFRHHSSPVVSRIVESSLYLFVVIILIVILLLLPSTRYSLLVLFPRHARAHVTHFIDGITGSLKGNWPGLIALTAGVWAMESLRLYLVIIALGVSLTIPQVVFTVMASIVLASIPVSFSGLGFVEGGITGLLMLFGMDQALGLGIIICDRIISFISLIVLGFISFLFIREAS